MRIFDSDNHYYEPYDAYTRHIDPKFRDQVIHTRKNDRGHNIIHVGDEPLRYVPAHPMDYVSAPGSLAAMFESGQAVDRTNPEFRMKGSDNPAFVDRDARLKFMDDEGIDGCMLYPSLGVQVEQALSHDPPATYANLRAFNMYLEDDWGYGADGRIYAVPLMSLLDLDMAIEELERVLALGAKAIHVRTGPINGRSPADPYFDPFWARLNEAGALLSIHSSCNVYYEKIASLWGEDPDPPYSNITPFQMYIGQGERPMADMLASLTMHGLFTRFANIRAVAVESGSVWLAHLLESLDHCAVIAWRSKLAPDLGAKPSEILRERLYISPYWEDDLDELTRHFPADHVVFGSDWPHAEGMAHPRDYITKASRLGDELAVGVMGKTAAGLVGTW